MFFLSYCKDITIFHTRNTTSVCHYRICWLYSPNWNIMIFHDLIVSYLILNRKNCKIPYYIAPLMRQCSYFMPANFWVRLFFLIEIFWSLNSSNQWLWGIFSLHLTESAYVWHLNWQWKTAIVGGIIVEVIQVRVIDTGTGFMKMT